MKNRLIAITFVLASMLAVPTAMGAADLEINTPAIAAIQGSMQSRHGQLAPYYASGAVGLTRDGLVAVRDANAVPLKDRQGVNALVAAENKDRNALRQGKYLFETRGCSECHGTDGRGLAFIDVPNGMRVRAPNITTGPGGVVSGYNEGDWVRAIRHGVAPSGHALMVMPSEDYNRMTDADFSALVAYVRSLPPVKGEPAELRLPLACSASACSVV